MGLYFNPSNESFQQAINSPIYMDKSMLIQYTNNVLGSEGKCIALSHARRFGKSQAAGMLKAYYSKGCDSRHQFENLEIANTPGWDKYLNKLNIIHLDMSTFAGNYKEDLVEVIISEICEDFEKEYSNIDCSKKIASIITEPPTTKVAGFPAKNPNGFRFTGLSP